MRTFLPTPPALLAPLAPAFGGLPRRVVASAVSTVRQR